MTADEPHFRPFEGEKYRTQKRFPGRLLVLGESHYLQPGDDFPEFTEAILRRVISDQTLRGFKTRYFRNVFYILTGRRCRDVEFQEWQDVWNSIAFYNYVQTTRLTRPLMRPTPEEWEQAREPFRRVLAQLEPNFILATGGAVCGHVTSLGMKAADRPGYCIPTSSNSTAYLRCTFHPSSFRFLATRAACRANFEELVAQPVTGTLESKEMGSRLNI